jgi:HTH-type transcriptional regulator/antitoxin MqsA
MRETMLTGDGRPMIRDIRPFEFDYDGRTITLQMPGWYDPEGREDSVHGPDDMRVSDRALNRLRAMDQGLLLPEEVRAIRKRLKLTQREAGDLVGGGPNAFQKYEAGDILVSRAVMSALLLLNRDPGGLEVLRARRATPAA